MLSTQPTERLVGFAQVTLSVVFLAGYFLILGLFLTGVAKPPPDWKDALMALLSVLTGGVMLILTFWFQRSRPQGVVQ